MKYKKLVQTLGFLPKDNTTGIFQKKYSKCSNYAIEIDFEKENFIFGKKIKAENKSTQNFSHAENWVVLECVDRLLEIGYQPESIILEKTWKTGRGTSGRLDILVTRNDGSTYLMIECKTWGIEFEKEFKKLEKNGGQLFTYFQQDKDADIIMLYASELDGKKLRYKNEIIKIEEDYRQTANYKDFYDRWNKLPKQNGIFDSWCTPYNFESKALTNNDLIEIKQEDSSFIFNQFLEILRHNVVSDKPNAFNKIFTLFLCKIYDEKYSKKNEELAFQWFYGSFIYEGVRYEKDTHIVFQKRLTDLYKKGMNAFLEKNVTDISDVEFDKKYSHLEEDDRKSLKDAFTEIRLKKNNEFAIKEVFNDESFEENAKVVKEVVELLQGYKIRYTKKQQYLSDFFELLLTTGLKQESGQFFTPVPVAQFVIKSLPLDKIVKNKLENGKPEEGNLLPYVIDYASGSGHFITESMHEIQQVLNKIDSNNYSGGTEKSISNWQNDHFKWAFDYVYGIEKDYRLVKVGKVGCYLHGDGLARIVHSDGLANFVSNTDFREKLKAVNKDFPQDNNQFDILVSNPPYSVSSFRNNARKYYKEEDFELYGKLTDNSSEIECLFVERAKQLLKEDGVSGIILPSSILSNTGIYSKTRELILQYFEIVGITELGSKTFMATGTNTVVLFLRRRDNYFAKNLKLKVDKAFTDAKDLTLNGVENSLSKYIAHTWEGISLEDYKTLIEKVPNKEIQQHEIYKEYSKKIKAKNEQEKWNAILALEQEKLLYFIIAYPQKVVLVKSGEKNKEKQFLGYEFSNRRGSEGIHAIQRSKSIDECTQLYDTNSFENPEKASTYIYKAFNGEFDLEIPESLQQNISYNNLVDMLTFDRVDFEKNISLSAKKKVNFDEVWKTSKLEYLNDITFIQKGKTITESQTVKGDIPVVAGGQSPAYFHNESNRKGNVITISASGANAGFVNYFDKPIFASDCNTIMSNNEKEISTKLIFYFLISIQKEIYQLQRGQAQPHVYADDLSKIKIPLPPIDIQEKIVAEIEVLETKKSIRIETIEKLKEKIGGVLNSHFRGKKLSKISSFAQVKGGKRVPKGFSFTITKTDFPYIRVSDFSKGTIDLSNLRYIDKEIFNQIKNYTISKDDIYISIAGTIGLVGIVPKELDNKSLTENAAKIVIKDNSKNIQKYIYFMLCSDNVKEQIKSRTKSVGVPKLAIKRIETIEIPLPSISEQQKIVSKIEKIETKISELEKQIELIPMQKEAVLKKYL